MLPTLVQEPPSGDKWLHEIKYDGYRTQLVLNGNAIRAFTRNGLDWSDCCRFVLDEARKLNCTSAVIDGEIIVQDEQGRPDFDNLKSAMAHTPERLIFYAFDLLALDGLDLRKDAVVDRRWRLRDLLGSHDPASRIQFSEHVIGSGPQFFQKTCALELEGIVSKKVTSRYCSGRAKAWVKTKAFVEGQFVVVGCDRNEGGPPFALLAIEGDNGLEYAGSAFVTLNDMQRDKFWRSAEDLTTSKPAVQIQSRTATWLRPKLRVIAKHLKCSGKLRHATLVELLGG